MNVDQVRAEDDDHTTKEKPESMPSDRSSVGIPFGDERISDRVKLIAQQERISEPELQSQLSVLRPNSVSVDDGRVPIFHDQTMDTYQVFRFQVSGIFCFSVWWSSPAL